MRNKKIQMYVKMKWIFTYPSCALYSVLYRYIKILQDDKKKEIAKTNCYMHIIYGSLANYIIHMIT